MNLGHDDLRALLAAYAIGAVDEEEAAAVREHLVSCDDCSQEFAVHLETAVAMSGDEPPASSELWERIASRLPAPAALPTPDGGHPSPPVSITGRRRGGVWSLLAAAAVVIAVGAIGYGIGQVAGTPSDLIAEAAAEARDAEGATEVTLTAESGLAVEAVLLADGTGYFYEHDLPALDSARTYQLWAVTEGGVVSAGVFGNDPGVVQFHAAGDVAALVLTEEPAGGVVVSEGSVIAAWERS